MIVLGQFLVTGVEVGLIVVRFLHAAAEVVGPQDLRDTTKEGEGPHMPGQPVV